MTDVVLLFPLVCSLACSVTIGKQVIFLVFVQIVQVSFRSLEGTNARHATAVHSFVVVAAVFRAENQTMKIESH